MVEQGAADDGKVAAFDFEEHSRVATLDYEHIRPTYEQLCTILKDVSYEALMGEGIKAASIDGRAKSTDSFRKKASQASDFDLNQPKYSHPLDEIQDLAGLRIVAFFPKDLPKIEAVIKAQFEIIERSDKSDDLFERDRFGYQSIHYIVRFLSNRTVLPEYSRFQGLVAEVQIRTILQHAWAEIEHDIQYKSTDTIPLVIRRRFMALAGLFEIADREFQAIQDEDEEIRITARASVQSGDLIKVEITPDALKAYLDKTLGSDWRISPWSYSWMASRIIEMGFKNFRELDECISGYDPDRISRILWGFRQGQLSRFEDTLLAALGDQFIERLELEPDVAQIYRIRLFRIRAMGIMGSDSLPEAPE